MNSVQLIGNLGRDAEIKKFDAKDGGSIIKASVSIAIYKGTGSDGKKETNWFDVECWGKTAEMLQKFGKKGAQLGFVGRLDVQKWTDKETDQPRSKVIVVAERITLCGSAASGSSSGGSGISADEMEAARRLANQSKGGSKPAPKNDDLDAIFSSEYEIPF